MKTLTIKITVSEPNEVAIVEALGEHLRYLFSDALNAFRDIRDGSAQNYVEKAYSGRSREFIDKKTSEVEHRFAATIALHNPVLAMEMLVDEGELIAKKDAEK